MEIEMEIIVHTLREHAKDSSKGPRECVRLLSILNSRLTEEQLNYNIDLLMVHICHASDGILKFVLEVLSDSKFDGASVVSLEILYTLINNFPTNIKEYITDLNDDILKILNIKGSAKVKTKALDVLILGFEKVSPEAQNLERYSACFRNIHNCLIRDIHPPSVRQKEFVAVGMFFKMFEALVPEPCNIICYYITQLDAQMVNRPSQSILYGIFTGLDHFCHKEFLSLERPEHRELINKVYEHIQNLSATNDDRRHGNRAAIAYFGNNMHLFKYLIIKKYKQWHKRLLEQWVRKSGDDKKVGEIALQSLLNTIATTLEEYPKTECLSVIKHFLGWFKLIMSNTQSTYTEKKLCIQGLKYFSSPLHKHDMKEDAKKMFSMVWQNFEELYIFSGGISLEESEESNCLPYYIQFQHFSHNELSYLQKAIVIMIKTFNTLKPIEHKTVTDALIITLFYLKGSAHFDIFLENIIYQGVIRSCSHEHIANVDLDGERENIVSVKNFFPFWLNLLKLDTPNKFSHEGIFWDDSKYILTKVVDYLVKTLIMLINKLNVALKLKDDVIQSDIEMAYQVDNPNDFNIFLNVTDFYQEIFPKIPAAQFQSCICGLVNLMVIKCLKCPFVSGFYKLLSLSLNIANKLAIFAEDHTVSDQDVINCKETLSKFLLHLLHKMKQFKDDLLISCLYVLLESPVCIVENLLSQCADIFITVFELGKSYIALANMGLSALERWQQAMDKAVFEVLLLQVIPYLDSYLRSKSMGGLAQGILVDKRRKTARMLKKRIVLYELDPELVEFQTRILRFVGKQNSKICQAFVSADSSCVAKVTSDTLHLKVMLPFNDLVLDIHLEPFVMRVIDICLNSSDRKNRVMACELLQAFVVIFLGRAKALPATSQSDLDELLKSIAMPLLHLACDMDQVVRQIFEPLFMQIIHWYTSKTQRQGPHLAVIIDVLMDGVTHSTNASLRDFSGKCINEFVKWSIKQYSDNDLKNNPESIKVLVDKMRFFSRHPDLVKKIGAALIFNNIYKEIREKRTLISLFAVEILHLFVISLDLLEHSNEEVDSTVFQIRNSINHLKRIFIEKSNLFRELEQPKRESDESKDIRIRDLVGVSKWLLSMTSSRSKYCRDSCMELFIHLQPLSGTHTTLSGFIEDNATNLVAQYMEHLQSSPTLADINSYDYPTNLLKWLQDLLCLVDGYIFILTNSSYSLNIDDKSHILSILYFLKYVQTASTDEALNLMKKGLQKPSYTADNEEEFLNLKASCCLAILKLANCILSDEILCNKTSGFWNPYFWSLMSNAIFIPSSLGFDGRLTQLQYKEVLLLLLNNIPRKLTEEHTFQFVEILKKYTADNFNADVDLKQVSCVQRNLLKGFLLIRKSRLNQLFKAEDFSVGQIDKLLSYFLKETSQVSETNEICIARTSEATTEYCKLVFEFALTERPELSALITHLYKNIMVRNQEHDNVQPTRLGLYLLLEFSDPIVRALVDGFDLFLESFEFTDLTIKIISELLKYLDRNKQTNPKESFQTMSMKILENWPLFQVCFERYGIEAGLDLVSEMYRLFGHYMNHSSTISNWILGLFCTDAATLNEYKDLHFYSNVFNVLVNVVSDDDLELLNPTLEKLKSKLHLDNVENSIVIQTFLSTLPEVKSATIFTFLIELYITSTAASKNEINLSDMLDTFMWKISDQSQKAVLNNIYCLGLDIHKAFDIKKKLIDYVVPHIFRKCRSKVFEAFFVENIKGITDEFEETRDCSSRLFLFSLLELLFLRVNIGSEERKSCPITNAYGNSNLRKDLLKITLQEFKNDKIEGSPEQLRILKCGVYKALASIITNSFNTKGFFEKLFVREENNEDILWSALIDLNVTYSFPVDFDNYPKRRKILINIRNELRQQQDQDSQKSFKYIESQKLLNSSLSEDVTKFDFTTSVLRTHSNINSNSEPQINQAEINLESTEVNSSEVMGTVCGVIRYMFSTRIYQIPEHPEQNVEIPNWMKRIAQLLLNPNTHANIKIFWVKVIDNMIHIFTHFSRLFVEPLLQFLNDKIAGHSLNYFVSDMIVILASWTSLNPPNERVANMASQFLENVITCLTNHTQNVFKYNLDLVRLIVENWKEFIRVPYKTLQNKLEFDIDNRENEVGVHLSSIFLVNHILPCAVEDINIFWAKMVRLLGSSVSTIYKPCSETLGLMLQYSKLQAIDVKPFCVEINKTLLGFNIDKYAHCLEGVAIHFTEIIDEYHVEKILNRLPSCDQNLQIKCLQLICKGVDVGVLSCCKDQDWTMYVNSQRTEVQLITLEIILKCVGILTATLSFKELLKAVGKKVSSPNVLCRARMYDIMISLSQTDMKDDQISALCNEILVQGLIDPDIVTRENIRKFWSENPAIPLDVSSKFPHLLSKFYLPTTEEHFLGHVSYFLLDSISLEEHEKIIFEQPLENCTFQEYKLQTNWRIPHPSMVPLFAETMRTYSEDSDGISGDGFERLRATEDNLTFAPTHQTIREQSISQITSLESSLIGKPIGQSRLINPNNVQLSEDYKLPKKRFLKDKAKISATFANKAISQRRENTKKRQDALKERDNKVTSYRSYRKGDFPDIQIKLGFLLKPLQMLVLSDSELSKMFISVLYKSLRKEAICRNEAFTSLIENSITNIFKQSIQFNSNVFSSLLDILLQSQPEIAVDSALISTVSQQSSLMSVGALLIEEYLINGEVLPVPSKRGIINESGENTHWLKLAELYRELDEWDMVKAIFIEKTNCKESVARAIALESQNKWQNAAEEYKTLIETDLSLEKRDFYCESLFKCLANLGKWEQIPQAVDSLVPESDKSTWNQLWDTLWFRQKILPWYVSAQVKNAIFASDDGTNQFILDVKTSIRDPLQSYHLRQTFSAELCVLSLTQNGFSEASQYLKSGLDVFLSEWQLLNPMFRNLRYNKMLKLQTLIEVDQFLQFAKAIANGPEEPVALLQDYWLSTHNVFPSMILNEAVLLYRKLFLKLLVDRLQNLNKPNLVRQLKNTELTLVSNFMNLAAEDFNYEMTRKYLTQFKSINSPEKLTMIEGSLYWMRGKLHKNDSVEIEQDLRAAIAKFKEVTFLHKIEDKDVITSFMRIIDINLNMAAIGRDTSDFEFTCESLKDKILSDGRSDLGSSEMAIKSKALLKLAYIFHDQSGNELNFVMCVLRAMKFGSKEGRQLFPCILLQDCLESDLTEMFITETDNMPTWMFLGWIPQLLANVDSSKLTAISNIILRIARTYPQAIMYSYRLFKENYRNSCQRCVEERMQLIDELDLLLLSDPLVDKFLKALSRVVIPSIALKYFTDKMRSALNMQVIMQYKDCILELLNENSDSYDSTSLQGDIYKPLKNFGKDFEKINVHNTIEQNKTTLCNLLQRSNPIKQYKYVQLKDYCPWLANFSAGRNSLELEIPGQYTGEKMPLIQHHIKVAGFGEKVIVMNSLRKPIKITMVGINGKEYPFLIKFGEDIRLDQRIQQLFILMNTIFVSDNTNHQLLTYQVVPLTSRIGLIQWVQNTTSLHDFIVRSLANKEMLEQITGAMKNALGNLMDYNAYREKPKVELIPLYRSWANMIPQDVLRKSVWSMSLTTEDFIALKNNFIKSYAVICACHWILGIGDRHLDNIKVCTKTGKLLGIDFGHAFGTATQRLPIPELVPIRLTPHLEGLMEPLKAKGLFRAVMIDCLRLLNINRNQLLATMNVFIQDPSVDWLEHAKYTAAALCPSQSSDIVPSAIWNIQQKIDQAKRKLQGASSMRITAEDLKSSIHYSRPNFQDFVEFVEGDENNLRFRFVIIIFSYVCLLSFITICANSGHQIICSVNKETNKRDMLFERLARVPTFSCLYHLHSFLFTMLIGEKPRSRSQGVVSRIEKLVEGIEDCCIIL
ncbi:hypothetical protein HUJ04_007350, partial [Dendroctonus ponderosae]